MAKTKAAVHTVELERVAIPSVKKSPEIETLAKKAQNVLGYRTLADRVLPVISLGATLKELEIEPFSTASVERYKTEQVKLLKAERAKTTRNATDRWGYRVRETVAWKSTPINQYTKAVPEFVLRKAIQIKEACPAAEIVVEELTVSRQKVLPKNFDPFLVVSLGREKYYVEVWDEAKFESKLF